MPIIPLQNCKLDESSPTPLHYQLRQIITEAIQEGQYGQEYKLPSERELAEMCGISRMTVRQATTSLVNDGVLMRKRGMGTYVSPPKVEQSLLKLTSFTEDMLSRGMQPSTRVLAVREVEAGENSAAKHLGLDEDDPIILLERLRLADGEPMAYERGHFPLRRFPDLAKELRERSLYEFLRSNYGVTIADAQQSLEAALATRQEADVLHVTKGSPLLLLQRTTRDYRGEVFEFVKSLYRADRYKFHVRLSR